MQLCPREVLATAGVLLQRNDKLFDSVDGKGFRNKYFMETWMVAKEAGKLKKGARNLDRQIKHEEKMGIYISW